MSSFVEIGESKPAVLRPSFNSNEMLTWWVSRGPSNSVVAVVSSRMNAAGDEDREDDSDVSDEFRDDCFRLV